jgi:hypothetical protein
VPEAEHKPLQAACVGPQPQLGAGFANPNFKELVRAIMRSQKCLREPELASDPKTKALKISDTFLNVALSSDSTPPMLAWPAYVIAS